MTATAPAPARLFVPYVAATSGLGVLLLGLVCALLLPDTLPRADVGVAVLAVLVIAAELRPITVRRAVGTDTVSLSGAFACALLLRDHWSLVVVVMAVASLADDVLERVSWWKAAFNVGQYTLSLGAAAGVLHLLRPSAGDQLHTGHLPAAVAACATFFVLNTVLTGAAFALRERTPVVRALLQDLPFQASVNGVVIAMAPLVMAVANDSVWLVGLLVVPVLAVHRGALSALERDHLSVHDALTGLPNQVAFRERLTAQLQEAVDDDRHVAVIVLTLDHFDDVNHTLGHSAGDDLLRQVADRLGSAVPPGAVVARLEAGTFLIAIGGLSSPWDASTCAERLQAQFSDPYAFADSAFALRASVGLTVAPLHGTEPEHLVQHAQVARDVARRARTGLEVYSAERNDFTARRLAVLRGLGAGLRRRQMTVHFQPQVDLRTGVVSGYEALLRWQHPELGTVDPDEFVPLAEHAGMMQEITDYVLDEALRRAAEWRTRGSDATVSVNVSASVLQNLELPASIARRLALWGVPSSCLVVELTETAVMSDPDRCRQVMADLRELQVGLSLDDYGTGYASLAYLTTLPVDELKIDKSFVLGMLTSRTDQVVVRSTLELARELGLRVVAEGVETAEVARLLASWGCRAAQGYHFGPALPPDDLVLDLRTPADRSAVVLP